MSRQLDRDLSRALGAGYGGEAAFLDSYQGAIGAYSLRDLSGSDPAVVRVRASGGGNDGLEADFTAGEVTDGTLVAFATSNGFVRTWYDQSGNGNHLEQTTAGAQPQIVVTGAVITSTSDGGPCLRTDGVDDFLSKLSVGHTGDLSVMVINGNEPFSLGSTRKCGIGETDVLANPPYFGWSYGATGQVFCSGNGYSGDVNVRPNLTGGGENGIILIQQRNNGNVDGWWNGTLADTETHTGTRGVRSIWVGVGQNPTAFGGAHFQEFVVWDGVVDDSVSDAANSHYGKY